MHGIFGKVTIILSNSIVQFVFLFQASYFFLYLLPYYVVCGLDWEFVGKPQDNLYIITHHYHFLSILISLSCFEEKCFFIKEGSQQQVKCSPLCKSKHSSIPKVESLVAINLDFILFITTFQGGGVVMRILLRLSPRLGARPAYREVRTRSPGDYQSQLPRIILFQPHFLYPVNMY